MKSLRGKVQSKWRTLLLLSWLQLSEKGRVPSSASYYFGILKEVTSFVNLIQYAEIIKLLKVV